MFGKRGYEVTLNRVHDTVKIKENDDYIILTVNADPMRLVAGLNNAQKKLTEVVNQTDPEDDAIREAAAYFAGTIFGKEQAEKLMDFYAGDAGCVINVCGTYFRERLGDKITKIQKRMKNK